MENNNIHPGTDAFGRELPEKTPKELRADIERILNYVPKPKEKPTLEDSINIPQSPLNNSYQKIDYKELSKTIIPLYGLYHNFFCNKCAHEEAKLLNNGSFPPYFFYCLTSISFQALPWGVLLGWLITK